VAEKLSFLVIPSRFGRRRGFLPCLVRDRFPSPSQKSRFTAIHQSSLSLCCILWRMCFHPSV
jgi:hypothetical protein